LFFYEQSVEGLIKAVRRFQKMKFDRAVIRRQAEKFDKGVFKKKILEYIIAKVQNSNLKS